MEYRIGDTVSFSAMARYWDGTTAITTPRAFEWNVVLVHCQVWFIGEYLSTAILSRVATVLPSQGYLCHQHSEVDRLNGLSGSFVVKDHAPDDQQYYFYEVQVVVRDACGRSDRQTRTVKVVGLSGQARS
jgi:hypothetical protein